VESCLADVVVLATSEFKRIERTSKLTHAALKRESKQLAKKPIELLQPQTREVFVLDVFVPFLADLLSLRDVIQPPTRARLGEVLSNTFQERARLQGMLGVAVVGWSHDWTDRVGMPTLRAKGLLSVIDSVGGANMSGVVEELNNIAKNVLALTDSKSSATAQLRYRGSAALSGRLQEKQNDALAMLTEMFSTSLRIVMAGVLPEGSTETKSEAAGRKVIHHRKSGSKGQANEIEMVVHKEKYDEAAERSRPAHNAFLWEAIVRFLTRQQDLSHKEGEVSIHLVDDAAHHTSADTLLGFLDVLSSKIWSNKKE